MKTTKQHKRYIPILIKEKLDKLEYIRKDDLFVIIDLIYRKEIYYKSDYQDQYGWTQISQAQFKQLLPSSSGFNDAMRFLIDNKLVIRNDYYVIKGGTSKSYKLPTDVLSKTVPVTISDRNINKRIDAQLKQFRKMKEERLKFAQSKFFTTFRIDFVQAEKAILNNTVSELKRLCCSLGLSYTNSDILDIINCSGNDYKVKRYRISLHHNGQELHNIMHCHIVHTMRLNAINDGFLFFKRNDTNGRLDSNLTSLPSYLRPYIITSEVLVNLDIKNSQPYFLYASIKDEPSINPAELKLYGDVVISGTLYELMIKRYEDLTGYLRTRKEIKQLLYKIFFSKTQSYQKYKDFFSSIFPSIMSYINETNKVNNNSLAIKLQKMESTAVLDVIMPILQNDGIAPLTIHDSFLCVESEVEKIRTVFIEKLTELFGIAPAMHMDYILPIVEEEEEEEKLPNWFDDLLEQINTENAEQEQPAPIEITTYCNRTPDETTQLVNDLLKPTKTQQHQILATKAVGDC